MGWNLRTKLCCVAPGKRNVRRDSLQQFYISYIIVWIVAFAKIMVVKLATVFPGYSFVAKLS